MVVLRFGDGQSRTTVMEYHYWGVYPNIDASTFAKAAFLDMDFKKSYDKHMLRVK